MNRNYIKVAFRNFLRYRWNSVFNIMGLSIGIACSIYISILLRYELGYDRFHDDINLIYRIGQKGISRGESSTFACVTEKNSNYILENYDGIEYMARFAPNRPVQVSYDDKSFMEDKHQFVEPDIFHIIKTEFLYGNRETCLERPYTIVLSRTAWQKYFDSSDPMGKLIKVDTSFFEVTGVIEDIPDNSRFRLDFFESWITYINSPAPEGWDRTGRYLHTYIKFKPEANVEAFEEWIKDIPELLSRDNIDIQRGDVDIFIQPLKGLHLEKNSHMIWDWENAANPVYIYILIGTVILILTLCGLNYINLNIASYSVRAREVSIRKTVGASRKQLVYQFMGESLILVFISHIIGLFLVELFIPILNDMTEMNLNPDYSSPVIWIIIISIILLLGLGAGSYPAFYLTRFSPAQTGRKNIFLGSGKFDFKEILIVIQFASSIILIIGTSLIYRQVNYMKNIDMGVSIENKLIISLPEGKVNLENREQVKKEFINSGLFSGASVSSSVPGRSTYTWSTWPSGEQSTNSHPINYIEVDYDYFDLYGLEIVAGSAFNSALSEESNNGELQNEEAIRVFGWDTPDLALTKTIGNYNVPIKGIIKNFHYKGLQKQIEPFSMFCGDAEDTRYLTLQYNTDGISEQRLDMLEKKFYELFPGSIFDYFFLEEDFNQQYKSEDKIVRLFVVFTLMALLIACIGMFGITAFFCLQKEKSTGVRKVFGADQSLILLSLIKRFSLWVLLAFLIAVPLSVLGIKMWLKNFAYQTNISVLIIIVAGLLSLVITIITVMYHSLKLSGKNPVDILRYE
ncbi:MAG TPA: FtsX-like permease family protein [Bacteroidales bacterium]|nr:FtsX-like permease family protein [Bacteroidales bacterium]